MDWKRSGLKWSGLEMEWTGNGLKIEWTGNLEWSGKKGKGKGKKEKSELGG